MCDQFMVGWNYAESFDEFKHWLLTKITAMIITQ